MPHFRNPVIRELTDQQMRFARREIRLKQIDHAELLLEQIDPRGEYSYQDLCERITAFRPSSYPDLRITGRDVAHDLRLFVEQLSDSVDLSAEGYREPVLTVEDVSRLYNVSTKTVDRWRDRGLVSRRFVFGTRKRIGFPRSTVERYVSQHAHEIERGGRLVQLTDAERDDVIRKARRLAQAGGCPTEISRRLARKMNRSAEAIRLVLKEYEKQNPKKPLFVDSSDTLSEDVKKEIFRLYTRGVPVEALSKKHGRTTTRIYGIVSEQRAKRLLDEPIDFIGSAEFEAAGADELILGPLPTPEKKPGTVRAPSDLPAYLSGLYTVPLLSREEEAHHFRKMNYLKFKAARLRDQLDVAHAKTKMMDQIERLLDEAVEVKNLLIRSNLRLVVSVAKKHVKPGGNFFEMVSDGNISLIKAIEKFDYSKGFKFSTYATWAIMKNFARSIPAEHAHHDRYRTGNDELFLASVDSRSDQFEQELTNHRQHEAIMNILSQLDDRERDIILQRFGLNVGTEPQTLEQLGVKFGVTKERIRQLETRALNKLRRYANENKLEIPGV